MGRYDFSCNVSMELLGYDGYNDYVRIHCYWKNNGWKYHMQPIYGWVTCNGEERCVYDGGYPDFQSDNQGQYELGYSDFTIPRGQSDKTWEYHARLRSDSSYASGERTSGSGYYTTGALAHHTVWYNANGGSGAPGSQTKWYGSLLYLSGTRPTREGYSFQGWATSSSGGVSYQPGAAYGNDSDVTLYAVWKANTWTVSYDANGGINPPGNQTKTYGQNLTLTSSKPTRTDYNFIKWNTKADGSGTSYNAGATFTTNANTTLYAIWELAYVRPRLNNISIARCTSDGTTSETGTYAKVNGSWETDMTGVYIVAMYKEAGATTWTSQNLVSNGTTKSGKLTDVVFGNNTLSAEKTYIVKIKIYDSKGANDSNYVVYSGEFSIGTQKFPIDVRAKGKGVAFGKVAERDDAVDIGFKALYLGGIKVLWYE